MLLKERTKAYLLSLAAAVLLMSNVYVGRAEEEPFEIVWQKDIGFGIEFYPFNSGNLSDNPIALSDKIGNFVIYRDSTNSFIVLNLTTGEFIKRLIVADYPNTVINTAQLLKNNSKFVVHCTIDMNNFLYFIFNTETWELEQTVKSEIGFISDDMSIIIYDNGNNVFYDFVTMKYLFEIKADFILWDFIGKKISISKDLSKIFTVTWSSYTPHESQPIYATLVQVFDIQTKKQILKIVYNDKFYALANDDISNVFVINTKTGNLENYNVKDSVLTEEIPFHGKSKPPIKLSKNQRFIYSGSINACPISKQYPYSGVSDVGTFADVGEDYIIGWIAGNKNNDYKNYLVKINIKDQNLVPVQDISNETEILYPNPVNAIVHIPNIQVKNISEIKVIDEKGTDFSKICTVSLLPDGIDLNLQKLNTGVYFIRVGNSEFSKTYKVIKS